MVTQRAEVSEVVSSPDNSKLPGVVIADVALEAGEGRIGGKAMGLAKLVGAGAPVPPWFVVPTEYFTAHVTQVEVAAAIDSSLAPLHHLDMNDPLSLKAVQKASETIQAAICRAPIPGQLEADVVSQLGGIGPGPFAVRSSMVGEDSASHSFAGQLDSFLFQKSNEEVVDSIRDCWASAFGDRCLAYHMRADLPLTGIRVGVVIQRMIDGQVSGVLFTANPVNGEREECLLTAAWGQGEGIVSGLCNTDEFVWQHGGQELFATLVDKDIKVAAKPNGEAGTVEMEVDAADRKRRCLDESQVAHICGEGVRIAEKFGLPQDIEWTIENNQVYIVQARPITSLPLPLNKDGPVVVWDNSNIQESYCGVTTPLTFSFASRSYYTVYRQTALAMSVPTQLLDNNDLVLRNLLGLIRGRVYYNINNWYKGLLLLPSFGTNKSDMERMMGLQDPVDFVDDREMGLMEKLKLLPLMLKVVWNLMGAFRRLKVSVQGFLDRFDRAYKKIDRDSLATASFSELMGHVNMLQKDIIDKWDTPIVNDFYVMMTNGRLARAVEGSGVDDPNLVQNNLIAGEEGIESTEPTRFLMRLAKEAGANSALGDVIKRGGPLEVLAELKEKFPAYFAKIDDYIERYGDRTIGELKLETISLREDPSFVVEVIRNYMDRPDLDPDALVENEKKMRFDAEALMRSKLNPLKVGRFMKTLDQARAAVKNRENMRLTRTRAFGLYRDIYRNIGRHLVAGEKLLHQRDVFYLTVEEIEQYHEGRAITTDFKGVVAARKAEFDSFEDQDLPHHFTTIGPVYQGNNYVYDGNVEVDPDATTLVGIGCYPGIVESDVRVISSPKDELSVNGKILVTMRTDPGWAPLFPTTSGILVERGSTLSHSAVVARELGIPAVVGIAGLTEIVQDGENVRMDGGKGTAIRLDAETESESPSAAAPDPEDAC